MRNFGCFLLLLMIAAAAVPVHASDVTLFGGYQHPGNLTPGSAAQGGAKLAFDPRDFGVFGFRSSQGAAIGGEHTIAYSPNFIDSKSRALIINSNVIVHVPLAIARPYVTAGIGAVRASGSGAGSIGTKFALNYGGGLKLSALGPVGGRIDVRGYTIPGVQSQTLKVLEVSLGLVFSF